MGIVELDNNSIFAGLAMNSAEQKVVQLGKSFFDIATSIKSDVDEVKLEGGKIEDGDLSSSFSTAVTNYMKSSVTESFRNEITSINKIFADVEQVFTSDTKIAQNCKKIDEEYNDISSIAGDLCNILSDMADGKDKYIGSGQGPHDPNEIKDLFVDFKKEIKMMINSSKFKRGERKGFKKLNKDIKKLKENQGKLKQNLFGVDKVDIKYSADPVNLSTGNFVYEHCDLNVIGEIPLEFTRYYNSLDRIKGVLGRCFKHNYEVSLETDDENNVEIRLSDGECVYFWYYDGTYHSALDEAFLEVDERKIVYHDNKSLVWQFNLNGQLIRKENSRGQGVSFEYDNGKLVKAKADTGLWLKYHYENDRLIKVEDNSGRTVSMEYEEGRLISVTTPGNNVYTYKYSDTGRVSELVNARNTTSFKNIYDSKNRVVEQSYSDGGKMFFEYDDENGMVVLSERNDSKIVYYHDELYRNVETLFQDGSSEKIIYNENNQKVGYVDRNGNEYKLSYDDKNNLTKVVDPSGRVVSYTYNSRNNLVSVNINGKQKIKNTYDAKGNLIECENAVEGKTITKYDSNNNPIMVETVDGNKTYIKYDQRYNIILVSDNNGRNFSYEYDELNRVIKSTDSNGNKTQYEYNANNKITRIINPMGYERKYCYNPGGKITEITDYDGNKIKMSYNEVGMLENIWRKDGTLINSEYDKMWNVSKTTYADIVLERNYYDGDNRLESKVLPNGGIVSYKYDSNGNCVSMCDPEGYVISYEYDELNRLKSIIDPVGARESLVYDDEGNVVKRYDANSNAYCFEYDAMGRCVKKTDALGNIYTYEYDKLGNMTLINYPDGSIERRKYEFGRIVEIIRRNGCIYSYRYDNNGNCVEISNSAGIRNIMEYDELNRVVKTVDEQGATYKYSYDAIGNLISVVDSMNRETKYQYNLNRKITKVIDALGRHIDYEYDSMDNLIKSDRLGDNGVHQICTFEWDGLGHLTKSVDSEGNVDRYIYDKRGYIKEKCDREGNVTLFEYDGRGLLNKVTYSDGSAVEYTYDLLRNLESVKDKLGITKIVNDVLGRVVSVTDPMGNTVSYDLDAMGNRKAVIYPDNSVARYEYNEFGMLNKLSTIDGSIMYGYDDNSRLIEKSVSNGMSTKYKYAHNGMLSEIMHEHGDVLEKFSYEYDLLGNKTKVMRSFSEQNNVTESVYSYEYDCLDRISKVIKDDQIYRTYGYDCFGNRSFVDEEGQKKQYKYNANNQLVNSIINGVSTEYDYDKRGNLVKVYTGDNVIKHFSYDSANKLTEAVLYENNIMKQFTYSYNGLGYKLSECENGMDDRCTNYVVDITKDHNNILAISENDTISNFVWDDKIAIMNSNGKNRYYTEDDLGSVIGVIDNSGRILERNIYDEFGVNMSLDSDRIQPFGFTGYCLEKAGIYNANARRYAPDLGLFVSKDKEKYIKTGVIDSWNPYMYCRNNPVNRIDVTGNDSFYIYIDEMEEGIKTAHTTENDKKIYGENGIHYFKVATRGDLINVWNNKIGFDENNNPVNIDEVILDMHGDSDNARIMFKSGENVGYPYDMSCNNIVEDLNPKNIDVLTLLICNAQNTKDTAKNVVPSKDNTISLAFLENVIGGSVLAADGKVRSGYSRSLKAYSEQPPEGLVINWLTKGLIEDKDWYINKKIDGDIETKKFSNHVLALSTYRDEMKNMTNKE